MTDTWHELPADPQRGYSGYTTLTRGTREIACAGVGDDVRKAMLVLVDRAQK